jgi:hypothetical protein
MGATQGGKMKLNKQKFTNRLVWKKKYLSDGSGSWYAAKVKILDWEYIVEDYAEKFYAGVFYSSMQTEDYMKLTKVPRKSIEQAKADCEQHLQKMYNKFKTWMSAQ